MQRSVESRYFASEAYVSFGGYTLLEEYEPYRYTVRDDNIIHVAAEGESWWSLAQHYYWGVSQRACGLWWVICDFQPTPVVDPTLAIAPGKSIVIPSPQTVQTEILGYRSEVFI